MSVGSDLGPVSATTSVRWDQFGKGEWGRGGGGRHDL